MPDTSLVPIAHSLSYPAIGIDAVLAGAARSYADRTAITDGDLSLSFAELHQHALRVAAGLRAQGVKPGDTIGLHMPNSLWLIVAYYGALCAGAAVAPLNPAQPPLALGQQLTDCNASIVITHPSCAARLLAAETPSVRAVYCIEPSPIAPLPSGADESPQGTKPFRLLLENEPLTGYRVDPELVAHLQFTGGTTGQSKAVRVLQRNLVANLIQVGCWRAACVPELDEDGGLRLVRVPAAADIHSIIPGDSVALGIAPLFHGLGLVGHNAHLALGVTVHLVGGRFDPDEFLAAVERHRVTQVSGSPAMYYAILRCPTLGDHDLTSMRLLTSGAAPIDTHALEVLGRAFPNAAVLEGYGLSEATMGVSSALLGRHTTAPSGTVGQAIFDTEIEIRDVATREPLPTGSTGAVWVRGPQVTAGYLGHPELTAEQFVDGWLHTGDMGHLDADGYLFLAGRSKDMIIYKGYNVYPQPLEEILCAHPSVAQAAVVAGSDTDTGEIPVAFLVLRPGVTDSDAVAQEAAAMVAERVAPYQKVRAVHVIDAMPLTDTGKVLKSALRERLAPSGA